MLLKLKLNLFFYWLKRRIRRIRRKEKEKKRFYFKKMSFFDDASDDGSGAEETRVGGGGVSVNQEMQAEMNADGSNYVRPEIPMFAPGNGIYPFRSFTFSKINDIYCAKKSTVLDICCGPGTNIRRWSPGSVRYMVLADPSRDALLTAIRTYNESNNNFPATPVQVDCFAPRADVFAPVLTPDICFDYVLCTSLAALRAFASHDDAVAFLRNATARIRPGGNFAFFFPNADIIRKMGTPHFTNSACMVAYNQNKKKGFGVECTVAIADRDGRAIPDAEGFLIEPELLIQTAERDCGMKLFEVVSFQNNYDDFRKMFKDIPITPDEVCAMSLFSTFIFKKRPPETKFHDQL